MASTVGNAALNVADLPYPSGSLEGQEQYLLDNAQRFSLVVLYRALSRLAEAQGFSIKVRPSLSLSLPRSEVVEVIKTVNDNGNVICYEIVVNLMGLYGAASPLPNFYTEDLIRQEKEDQPEARLFLDLFHQQYYQLLISTIEKHTAVYSLANDTDSEIKNILLSLIGFGTDSLNSETPKQNLLLRYRNLFRHSHRSALGLKTMLSDVFAGTNVEVEECVERNVRVDKQFQVQLGGVNQSLGVNALVGNQLKDCSSQCRVYIGPMKAVQFHQLVNTASQWTLFIELVSGYLKDLVRCELIFKICKQETNSCQLGGSEWNQLGVDTWVYDSVQQTAAKDTTDQDRDNEQVLVSTHIIG